MTMHGNVYQKGFPDIFATHYMYGMRLIEVKLPNMEGSKFTPAQLEQFPKMVANGARLYILTAATKEEYDKLFEGKSNLYSYLPK